MSKVSTTITKITCDVCGVEMKEPMILGEFKHSLLVKSIVYEQYWRSPIVIDDICESCNKKLVAVLGLK